MPANQPVFSLGLTIRKATIERSSMGKVSISIRSDSDDVHFCRKGWACSAKRLNLLTGPILSQTRHTHALPLHTHRSPRFSPISPWTFMTGTRYRFLVSCHTRLYFSFITLSSCVTSSRCFRAAVLLRRHIRSTLSTIMISLRRQSSTDRDDEQKELD